MAAPNNTADLAAILGRFSDARCVLECAVRCLEEHPDRIASDEAVCLRHGLDLVESVYNDFDRALLSVISVRGGR